ncbi:MAG: hypothetical protein NW200_05055 [Hyphomonadaceae bacterium]|nr:hypothetical protein [Hyphomonadaceae bacterium]
MRDAKPAWRRADMIFRRISEHVKAQNWFAVAIDFVIVVVGVFIGIQVANWNVARADRAAEAVYLSALELDVVSSIKKLERFNANLEAQEKARAALYAYSLDPAATLQNSERNRLLSHAVFYLPSLNLNQVTFDTLKSSGDLRLIRSKQLVAALQTVSAQAADLLVLQADEFQITYMFSDPMLVDDFDMRSIFQEQGLDREVAIPWLPKDRIAFVEPPSIKTRRFRNILLYRSYFTESRRIGVRTMLEQHRRIARLIDERQRALGVPE